MLLGIVGAGLSGSVLYSLLKKTGFSVDIYDHTLVRGCKSSIFFFNNSLEYKNLVTVLKMCGVNFKDYIIRDIKNIIVNGDEYKLKTMIILCVDKSKLIEDLVPRTVVIDREISSATDRYITKVTETGHLVKHSETVAELMNYKVLIDCSGSAKILIPGSKKYDYDIRTCQFLVKFEKDIDLDNSIIINPLKIRKGHTIIEHFRLYPLADNNGSTIYHACIMGYKTDLELWRSLEKILRNKFGNFERLCGCNFKISGSIPMESFICGSYEKRYLFGCGESIGLTDCFGNGNVYSILSAYYLFQAIRKYDINEAINIYRSTILKKFKYLNYEKESIKKGNMLSIASILKSKLGITFPNAMKIILSSLI